MAIDWARALTLSQVPDALPPDPLGRPLNMATVYLWYARGRSGVRLEAERRGRNIYTDRAALARFIARVAQAERRPEPVELIALVQKGTTPTAGTVGVAV